MLLKEAGGEFAFIRRIKGASNDGQVIVPNGDDATVFKVGEGENTPFFTISTDTIVEGDHFSFDYFSPYQVGMKAIESSVSDIVAIGGKPKYIFLSLCLPSTTHIEPMEEIYRGIGDACERCGCKVLGGDTTHGPVMVISVTVTGEVGSRAEICPRSAAKAGDLIYATGPLGGSIAGLLLLRRKIDGYESIKRYHLEPKCRIDLAQALPYWANAMIDVSDGLSSEIHHICQESGVGAIVNEDAIPLAEGLRDVGQLLGMDPYTFAYSGGEDFQLIYTISPQNREHALGTEIGIITADPNILVRRGEVVEPLPNRGYDHFLLD